MGGLPLGFVLAPTTMIAMSAFAGRSADPSLPPWAVLTAGRLLSASSLLANLREQGAPEG